MLNIEGSLFLSGVTIISYNFLQNVIAFQKGKLISQCKLFFFFPLVKKILLKENESNCSSIKNTYKNILAKRYISNTTSHSPAQRSGLKYAREVTGKENSFEMSFIIAKPR